jgi:hypothetical protein
MRRWILILLFVPMPAFAQVAVNLSPVPRMQFFSEVAPSVPLAGGKVCTYNAGTTTPAATYVDNGGVIQNTNPIILDSSGFATIWLAQQGYKFVVYDGSGNNSCPNSGVQQWSVDNISASQFTIANTWSALQTFSGGISTTLPMTLTIGGNTLTLSASVSGNRTYTLPDGSGNIVITGVAQAFSALQTFSAGVASDSYFGTQTVTPMAITGKNGTIAAGQGIQILSGTGDTNQNGGASTLQAGNSGASSGLGGAVFINGGSGVTTGGSVNITGGVNTGSGTGKGGSVNLTGAVGGSLSGNGGDIVLSPGAAGGTGNRGNILLNSGPVATGPLPTLTGTGACATITTQAGGAWGGSAKCTGTTGASTLIITFNAVAPNGWNCFVQDETTRANVFQQTAHAFNSCTLTVTSVTQNDVFVFSALAF